MDGLADGLAARSATTDLRPRSEHALGVDRTVGTESVSSFLDRAVARRNPAQSPMISANISGATIDASDSMTNLGVSASNLPQVIFSFGTAPEYEP